MKYEQLKKATLRIAKIKDPLKCQRELIELAEVLKRPRIETRTRGNYTYFYEMELFYNPEVKGKRERVIEKIGRIKKEEYQANPSKFKSMSKSELKKTLEQYQY